MLEFQDISKSYPAPSGEVQALQNVSFSLSSGECLLIKGPSGCGKTTLLLVAGCLLIPGSGRMLVNGNDPAGMHARDMDNLRARTFGFVFQQYHLIPYLTVEENILSPSLATKDRIDPNSLEQLIRKFGLEGRIDHLPHQLSAGEKQRTALARAVFNNPDILLADEPTGNLDEENAGIIYSFLEDYASGGGSVLLVSHDSKAVDYASRILNMESGRINPV